MLHSLPSSRHHEVLAIRPPLHCMAPCHTTLKPAIGTKRASPICTPHFDTDDESRERCGHRMMVHASLLLASCSFSMKGRMESMSARVAEYSGLSSAMRCSPSYRKSYSCATAALVASSCVSGWAGRWSRVRGRGESGARAQGLDPELLLAGGARAENKRFAARLNLESKLSGEEAHQLSARTRRAVHADSLEGERRC